MSNAARATLGQKASLATVALRLGIKRMPRAGKLKAVSKISTHIEDAQIGAVFTQVDIFTEQAELLASGSALMGLAPFKNSLNVDALPVAPRAFADLAACRHEVQAADLLVCEAAQQAQHQATEKGTAFIDQFWAAKPLAASAENAALRFCRGEHLANRSGNVHGGVLYGLQRRLLALLHPWAGVLLKARCST